MRYENIFDLVGETPTVKFDEVNHACVYAKLEGQNPSGSLKARSISRILLEMEKHNKLKGRRLLDTSSGSAAVALATFGPALGYEVTVVVNEKISSINLGFLEKRSVEVIKYGKVTGDGYEKCCAMVEEDPDRWAFIDQLNNEYAPLAHYDGTAEEILRDVPNVSTIVGSMGSGATLLGIAQRLRDEGRTDVKLIASVGIPGDYKKITGTYSEGADYVSPFITELQEDNLIDKYISVSYDDAEKNRWEVLKKYGHPVGPQTGGVFKAAKDAIAQDKITGDVVIVSGDTGWKWPF